LSLEFIKNPAMVWFIIGLICVISEFAIPGVIIIFFGIGAWVVALILLGVDLNIFLQLLVFLVFSITALVLVRKKVVTQKEMTDDVTDDFLGKKAEVLEGFSKGAYGKVFFKGTLWKAETTSEKSIKKGEYVVIIGHESILLQVEPVNNNA